VKYASLTLVVLGFLGVGFTACATGDRPEFGNQPGFGGAGGEGGGTGGTDPTGTGGTNTTSSTVSSGASSTVSSGSGGNTCVTSCTGDSQCQSSCQTPPTGVNCCDGATGTCYVAGGTVCPSVGGSGSGGSMY
jgi:hypothetical protein